MSQALEIPLSGQELAGRAEDEVFFRVEKTVVATTTYLLLAGDGFESGSGSGGTDNWTGDWILSGDYSFSTYGEYEGDYHLRLRGDSNDTPGDGYAEREVDLSGSSGLGPYLNFWARIDSLESSDNDVIEFKVSTNGIDWDVLETFDHNDSDDQYHQYRYDLSSYGTPSTFSISFEMDGDHDSDTFYLDDIKFTNSQETTVVEPGVLTEFTYYVSIECVDPDGCDDDFSDLDRIVDELPERGASSGDYLQYIPGSTEWDVVVFDSFTFDGFESGSGSGGTGNWTGNWALSGDYSFSTYGEYEGDYHLRLRGDGDAYPGNGYAQREVDLSSSTGTGPFLYFWARIDNVESGNTIEVRVSTNGEDWNVLETFDHNDSDDQYHQYWYDLSSYGRPSTFYVSFKMNGDHYSDTFYVDNVEFSEYQGTTAGEWPVPPFESWTSEHDSGSDLYQELEWDFEDAGYYDIDFAYGETRNMSFKAEAALEEGTYCNYIWVSNSSYGDEGGLISGTTAKIIVGDPEDTRCSGGLVVVEKISDPVIVYPYEETLVTYTITIENVDTIDVRIYEVEDWLPATGSTEPEEGFIYVDNSAHGRIIRPLSIAFDGFESGSGSGGTGDWSDNWTLSGDYSFSTYGEYEGDYHLRLRGDDNETPGDGYAQRSIDLSGYSNTDLRFFAMLSEFESGDEIDVLVSTNGVDWDVLRTFVNGEDDGVYRPYTYDLSGYGSPSTFYLAFDARMSSEYDYFYVDNIEFIDPSAESEIPVCMPDENEGSDFFYEDWEYDWPYWEYRWSLTRDFSNYPDSGDAVWDSEGLCEAYEYADYDPYLLLHPGEIFEIVFQAEGTLTYSGSYFNEVFVHIDDEWDEGWIYSWPTGTIIVPQFDLQAETLHSVLRANALLGPEGSWWRSWHWWWW